MRVLTLNMWARSGPYGVRGPLLRQEVGVLAPDLIALQEVEPGPGDSNQASELFAPLGYEVAYQRRDGENRADPGIAVASRPRINDRHLIELPHGGAALAVRVMPRYHIVFAIGRALGSKLGTLKDRVS